MTGPSFAREVVDGLPTAVTVHSDDVEFAQTVAEQLHGPTFRAYTGNDMLGAELGGAMKNVLAVATGVADGMQLGLNARAGLITRGLNEMLRLGVALGARAETLMGLAGLGDLVLTCTGDLSRNRRLGLALGRGTPLREAVAEIGQVVEACRRPTKSSALPRATASSCLSRNAYSACCTRKSRQPKVCVCCCRASRSLNIPIRCRNSLRAGRGGIAAASVASRISFSFSPCPVLPGPTPS